ncbi:MAG: UDP-glucose 4-epimerase GalE, partial [Bacteroidales bacterium]|nr:UDP-glucose 4-epimerase GalE [Bacteroidales bacterium]
TVELMQQGYEVTIVDNLSNSSIDVLDGIAAIVGRKPEFANIDCGNFVDLDRVFKTYPDIVGVIHFAASKAVGESVQKPLLYYRNNLNGLINVLEMMEKHGVKGLVFSSSCTVYGQPEKLPVTEETPFAKAESPYGNTKKISEEIIQDTLRAVPTLKAIALRYFNPIGAHPSAQIGELPNGTPNNLMPYITQTAIGIRECLSVFGNDYNTPDGTPIRDYINVVDLAKAHVAAVKHLNSAQNDKQFDFFNIGTGKGSTVLEIVDSFERSTGVKLNYKIVGRRAGDIEKVWADTTKANKVLGWKAEKTLDETTLSAWEWEKHLRAKSE